MPLTRFGHSVIKKFLRLPNMQPTAYVRTPLILFTDRSLLLF